MPGFARPMAPATPSTNQRLPSGPTVNAARFPGAAGRGISVIADSNSRPSRIRARDDGLARDVALISVSHWSRIMRT